MDKRKYEVSHICAAAVATVAIVGVVVVVSASLALTWTEKTTFHTQGSKADWILAGCAVVGIVTSLIGLGLLMSTLSANRAMVVSTDRSVKLVAAFNKTQLRPWLAIDFESAKLSDQPDGSGKLEIKIKNVGLSSANNVFVRAKKFECKKLQTNRAWYGVQEYSDNTVDRIRSGDWAASILPGQDITLVTEVDAVEVLYGPSEGFPTELTNNSVLVCVHYDGAKNVWDGDNFWTACCLWHRVDFTTGGPKNFELISGSSLAI